MKLFGCGALLGALLVLAFLVWGAVGILSGTH